MALTLRGGYVSANLDSNGKEEMGLRDMLIFSRLSSPEEVNKLSQKINNIKFLYIADGHHRIGAMKKISEHYQNKNNKFNALKETVASWLLWKTAIICGQLAFFWPFPPLYNITKLPTRSD